MDSELNLELLKAIDIIVKQRIQESLSINFYEGIIRQCNKNNTYDVESAGTVLNVHRINNDTYVVGDVVIVLILGTQKYILTKKDNVII